jgi:hypothetical protein
MRAELDKRDLVSKALVGVYWMFFVLSLRETAIGS